MEDKKQEKPSLDSLKAQFVEAYFEYARYCPIAQETGDEEGLQSRRQKTFDISELAESHYPEIEGTFWQGKAIREAGTKKINGY